MSYVIEFFICFTENLNIETKRLEEEHKNLKNLQFGQIPVELVGFNR